MPSPRHYLGLCGIAKNETPNLREWVAYHHAVGFERILIYDNDSAVPVRDTLADMCDSGLVETLSIRGENMQLVAYNHCLQNYGHEFVWLAFFDLDEFLLIHGEDDARIFCAGYEDYPGISLNWCTFSSSGHLKRPPGLVIENYLESLEDEASVKCIVKPAEVSLPLSPHHFIFKDGSYAVLPDKTKIDAGHAPPETSLARINHYRYRSQQDYEEKVARGYAMPHTLEMGSFYGQAHLPVTACSEIVRHAPKVKEIMAAGTSGPYIPLDTSIVLAESFPAVMTRLAAAIESDNISLARLIFSINKQRFSDKPGFSALGTRLSAGTTGV